MKKGPGLEQEQTRGLAEAADFLNEGELESYSEQFVSAAKRLLSEAARQYGSRVLVPEKFSQYLARLKAGTVLEDLPIENRGVTTPETRFESVQQISVIFGPYGQEGAYNVWVMHNVEGKLVLAFNQIPQGGNYRGHDGWARE